MFFIPGSGEGFGGSRIDEHKLAPSSLTFERRPHKYVSKTVSGTSES